jgi:hypothetical protein
MAESNHNITSSDDEQYEGGSGNIVLDSLMRVRAKNAQDHNKWQDKTRFGHQKSKVKKAVKVEERVK